MPHPLTPQDKVVRPILLSLDGGGAKGLSTLLILQELMERIDRDNPPKPCHVFDMIGGTSTGGLIAIMLGRLEMSVADCIEAYQHISRQVFRQTFCGKYWRRAMRTITGRSMYDGQKFEDVVKSIIQAWGEAPNAPLETTDDDQCKVFVCATQCLNRSQVQFCSYRDPVHHNRAEGIKIWEAARATSAASAYFDPIKIGPHSFEFVDGGIGTNNPVFETRNCARDLWQASSNTNFDEQIRCLVSIGAGVGQSYSAKGLDMRNNFSPFLTDTEATASRFASSHEHLAKANKYFRLTIPSGIGNIDLVDTSKPEDILGRTFMYLEENCTEQLDQCAKVLRAEYRPEHEGKERFLPIYRYGQYNTERTHSKRSRIDLVAFKTAGSGCWWISLCLTVVVLIIGMIFADPGLPPIDRSAPVILLVGQTGAGKSTFIAQLGGRHISTGETPVVGHWVRSETSTVSWYRAFINHQKVYLIDTPGLEDHRVSDFQTLKHISDELQKRLPEWPTSQRHHISQLDYLNLMMGDEAFANCALVTTRWDLNSSSNRDRQEAREEELKQTHWADMISGGSTAIRHDGTRYSAEQIISSLMGNPKIVLYHQHERGKEKKSFRKTKAGIKAAADKARLDSERSSMWKNWI
ncbi:hypothetical protein CEP52_008226 [Fusarium oligoseptatum]|uniref:PNPLA domain-containing protein n=1 Tax=Fusarium oligoseptatum TaxID=2604345 RepID=A0A428TJ32_9HYPO|nr:hypothetical protein CEP52_008226 [Fusarium oligoseptatum]